MPWTPSTFKKRHGLKLSIKQSKKAAEIANAIVADGGDEGLAIAVALKQVKYKPKKKKKKQ